MSQAETIYKNTYVFDCHSLYGREVELFDMHHPIKHESTPKSAKRDDSQDQNQDLSNIKQII